jgi:hypothetical protein
MAWSLWLGVYGLEFMAWSLWLGVYGVSDKIIIYENDNAVSSNIYK